MGVPRINQLFVDVTTISTKYNNFEIISSMNFTQINQKIVDVKDSIKQVELHKEHMKLHMQG